MMVTVMSDSYLMTDCVLKNVYYPILVILSGCQSQPTGSKLLTHDTAWQFATHPASRVRRGERRVEASLDAIWSTRPEVHEEAGGVLDEDGKVFL